MATSIGSGRPPFPNTSYITPSLPGGDSYQTKVANAKVLGRATLKIDFYVIPIVTMFYLLSLLERSTFGYAGLMRNLDMTPYQASTALSITYAPYILMGFPMNLLMKRLGANITFSAMVVLWGIVCACQGAVQSYHGLLVCRFFLGALEGGLFPGIVLLLTSFYKRHAMQKRFAMMFSVTSLAGAFSGLLVLGIQNLDGKLGIAGWQWIFIIEGVVTIAFGLHVCFFIPTSPRDIKILTDEEREAYCRALADDWSGDADIDGKYQEVFSWNEVASAFTDAPHVIMLAVPLCFNGLTIYSLDDFTPSIAFELGYWRNYSRNRIELLKVYPFVCSFVFNIVCAYFCDKFKRRGSMAVVCSLLAAIGYSRLLRSTNESTDYAVLYLAIIGSYGSAPCLATWLANNIQPHYRRATAVAIAFLAANIGGIVSTWFFILDLRNGPAKINLGVSLGTAFSSLFIMIWFRFCNAKKRERVENYLRTYGQGLGRGEWDSTEERRRLGDRHPRFEFTL